MNLTLQGSQTFKRKLAAAAAVGPPSLLAALFQEANVILTASKQDYVPVDTGALRASGFVEPPVVTPEGGSVTLGFGGPSAPYAVIVHEDLTKRHPVGQAKYLEIPLRARIEGMAAVLRLREQEAIQQAVQRVAKTEANLAQGRAENFGMPLFEEPNGAAG
jgi:hypothetical protein